MSDDEIEALRLKKCAMNGIVLDDPEVVLAMDKSGAGIFVPAKFKKGELSGSLIGLKQLGALKKKADGVLLEMAKALHGGEIPAIPAVGKSYKNVCEYCDYKSVCSYEDDIPVRELIDSDIKTVLENLERGDDSDEVDGRSAKSH